MKKRVARIVLFLLFSSLVVAISFFVIRYTQLNSKISTQKEESATLQSRVDFLEFENAALSERNSELLGNYQKSKESLFQVRGENLSLRDQIEDLKELIRALNAPPVSPDASTPWERFLTAFEYFKKADYGAYWEFFNSAFKNGCSKRSYTEEMSISYVNPFVGKDVVVEYVDQRIGIYATVELKIEKKPYTVEFMNEEGEWFFRGDPPLWCSRY